MRGTNYLLKPWLACSLLFFFNDVIFAAERIALVIGNSDYTEINRLPNPRNDAEDVAEKLLTLGFELHGGKALYNLDERSLLSQTASFAEAAEGAAIAFFYFAGHGMQFDGDPHLLPVDIPDDRLSIVRREAVGLNSLLADLAGRAKLTVAVFDACREIPDYTQQIKRLARGGTDAPWRGLSRPKVQAESTLIAYSGGSGELVADGTGRNSPYTEILLSHLSQEKMQQAGWDVPDLFSEVSYQFRLKHDGQRPEVINQGVRPNHFYLASFSPEPLTPTEPTRLFSQPTPLASDRELELWRSVEAGNRLEEYALFIARFPQSMFSDVARSRIQKINRSLPTPMPWSPELLNRKPYEPEMVRVAGGCYQMGSSDNETGRSDDERAHRICVSDMAVAKTEITVAQFRVFIQATGHRTEAELDVGKNGCYSEKDGKWGWHSGRNWQSPGFTQGTEEPVVCVSWNDAMAYVAWLNEDTGGTYRLPTEAEWEYAARAGANSVHYWGDSASLACRYANVADEKAMQIYADRKVHECNDGVVFTAPVGRYEANSFGLFDMLGNVWEWTCSERDEAYGGNELRCKTGQNGQRSLRGGSWDDESTGVRSAYRGGAGTAYRTNFTGLRLFGGSG